MSYINAKELLPLDVLDLIQQYIEGECIYIPKKEASKKAWGEGTTIKHEMEVRNREIYEKYCNGVSMKDIAEAFFLSVKSIQRIVRMKRKEEIVHESVH